MVPYRVEIEERRPQNLGMRVLATVGDADAATACEDRGRSPSCRRTVVLRVSLFSIDITRHLFMLCTNDQFIRSTSIANTKSFAKLSATDLSSLLLDSTSCSSANNDRSHPVCEADSTIRNTSADHQQNTPRWYASSYILRGHRTALPVVGGAFALHRQLWRQPPWQ